MSEETITIQVPHRISGFFEIVDEINGKKILEPVNIGSRGAGFNLSGLGSTTITLEKLPKDEHSTCSIYINQELLDQKAETSFSIFNKFLQYIKNPVKIKIEHDFQLPVGCGYGASGSGALGLSFGLNKLLNLNLNNFEIGKIAHISEVINKTGLGTVCGQLGGGMCALTEPGYPCKTFPIDFPPELNVICGTIGKIQTRSILSDPLLSKKIKKAGYRALKKLIKTPDYLNFIRCSSKFVEDTEILEILQLEEIKEMLNELNKLKIHGASMNQLGRSVYCFCEDQGRNKVLEILNTFKPKIQIFQMKVNKRRAFDEF